MSWPARLILSSLPARTADLSYTAQPARPGRARQFASTRCGRHGMGQSPGLPARSAAQRRGDVRSTLPLVLLLASVAGAQLPTDGRASYAREDRIQLPFD